MMLLKALAEYARAFALAAMFSLLMFRHAAAGDHTIEFGFSAITKEGGLPHYRAIKNFESRTGVAVKTMNWYMGFNGDDRRLPDIPLRRMSEYANRDITLMLTLEPWGNTTDWKGRAIDPLGAINDGLLDSYIRKMARQLRDFGHPIRLRFGHEMIQDDHLDTKGWYSWQDRPEAYRSAFIRVRDIFIDEHALNVEFVWSPNYSPAHLEILKKYYPGPEYVDWIGMDGYNWNGESFDGIFKGLYQTILEHPEVFGQKPIMIAEFACGADKKLLDFNKARWMKDAFSRILIKYPLVKAVYWLNLKKERDWRLDSSPESLDAFKGAMKAWQDQ